MAELFLPKWTKVGVNSFHQMGEVARELHATHLFVVTGSLFTKDPFNSQMEEIIRKYGLKATFFSGSKGEPTTDELNMALSKAQECKADCVVAAGGGSVIDLAKALSVMAVNRGISLDCIPDMTRMKRLPLIAIPTTAGTGSEATKVTVITDSESNIKKNPAHYQLIPDAAILDPILTVSLPRQMTAYTGLDALAHAMEAYVSTKATPMSSHFALEAIRIIGKWLPKVYKDLDDLEARENMLLGSFYAGVAFTNASTNLAHATARPLGAKFHIPHGLSVALLMPLVIEEGLDVSKKSYADIGIALGGDKQASKTEMASYTLSKVRHFNQEFQIWQDGSQYIRNRNQFSEAIPYLTRDALAGNGIKTNCKVPNESDIERIYKNLLNVLEVHQEVH
ncbi:iron-containing alcohol dehydrogenase [Bacillus sp. AK031]